METEPVMTLVSQTPKPVFISELPAFLLETTKFKSATKAWTEQAPQTASTLAAAIKKHIGF